MFLTDGRSNDPSLDICTEIRCLHNRRGVNTFAIGIANFLMQELECIVDADLGLDDYHVFDFLSFDEFEEEFQTLLHLLLSSPAVDDGPDSYKCVN